MPRPPRTAGSSFGLGMGASKTRSLRATYPTARSRCSPILYFYSNPSPHPLLAVEEPENQLYPELLAELVEEFRDYATRGGQVFVSTHSPDFLNGAKLDEIYWLAKEDGFTRIMRASDTELLTRLVEEG
jgi:predicted ATPase